MSLDVFFYTCNLGTNRRPVKNLLTEEETLGFDDPGLTRDERAAILKLLIELKAKGPNELGYYTLSFADGGAADLSASGLEDSERFTDCMVEARGLTPEVINFLFRLSRDGNMQMNPAMEGTVPLVAAEEQRQRIVARFPEAKVVPTAAALEKELRLGFEAWAKYRDQVIGDK